MIVCPVCGKTIRKGFNRPHSLHKTKRKILPNIQKREGKHICTRCLRTQSKKLIFKS